MNGNENSYAGALFFALASLGAFLKLDGELGLAVGAVCALIAAISLRRALSQSAQAAEEDHQRLEIQFQQLRSKIIETSSANFSAMTAVSDAAHLVQENFQVIRVRLAELDNLTQLTQCTEAIRSALSSFDGSYMPPVSEPRNFPAAQEQNLAAIAAMIEELQKLNAIEEANRASLQTVLKLLQVIGQMLKNPAYAKDLGKISAALEAIASKNSPDAPKTPEESPEGLADGNRQDLSLRQKIAAKLRRK